MAAAGRQSPNGTQCLGKSAGRGEQPRQRWRSVRPVEVQDDLKADRAFIPAAELTRHRCIPCRKLDFSRHDK
jgi:hypothetical protein